MKRLVLFCVMLSGCAQGAQKDLPSIAEARSLAAEWALVNEQESHNRLTHAYAQSMRASIREQLSTIARSLSDPHSASIVSDLLTQPDDSPPGELRASGGELKKIEDQLESA